LISSLTALIYGKGSSETPLTASFLLANLAKIIGKGLARLKGQLLFQESLGPESVNSISSYVPNQLASALNIST
jgi:hypothetical protein